MNSYLRYACQKYKEEFTGIIIHKVLTRYVF